jgi:ABC-type Fe3+-hydroxamate transport system substrate-binding protein
MFIDTATYTGTPKKIISLVPSITELLFCLGLNKHVVGITKFCVHPDSWFKAKEKIGGTKNINIQKIIDLQPDLVICNKEENVKAQIEKIADLFPVYLSDVNSYSSALNMIMDVGNITKSTKQAIDIINGIEDNFRKEKTILPKNKRVAYLIWKDPYMTVGGDTFISNILEKIGLENIFNDQKRYPQITIAQIQNLRPDILILSTEPYPFKEIHLAELKKYFTQTNILMADGEMFSWYGSRMLLMPAYFRKLLLELV